MKFDENKFHSLFSAFLFFSDVQLIVESGILCVLVRKASVSLWGKRSPWRKCHCNHPARIPSHRRNRERRPSPLHRPSFSTAPYCRKFSDKSEYRRTRCTSRVFHTRRRKETRQIPDRPDNLHLESQNSLQYRVNIKLREKNRYIITIPDLSFEFQSANLQTKRKIQTYFLRLRVTRRPNWRNNERRKKRRRQTIRIATWPTSSCSIRGKKMCEKCAHRRTLNIHPGGRFIKSERPYRNRATSFLRTQQIPQRK